MANFNYVGNPDFRGYIAANAPDYLTYVGNDGGVNSVKLQNTLLSKGYTQDQLASKYSQINDDIKSLYGTFQGLKNAGATDSGPAAGGSSNSSSSGVSTSADPSMGSYFDSLIGNVQGALNRLPNQQAIGEQNVQDAYNSQFNKLIGQKAVAERNYNTSKTQSAQDNVKAKNSIDVSVGNQANSLSRLLGAHGAGSSSAAQIVAPYAAARQGTVQRNEVQDTFARNNQALDTNWGDYQTDWNTSANDLSHQKDVQIKTLKASVDKNKADLLSQLANLAGQKSIYTTGSYRGTAAAMAPYQAQANSALAEADNLAREYANPVIQATDVKYNAPSLDQYTYDKAAAPTVDNSSAYTDTITPYLSLILGKNKNNNGLLV